MLKIIKLMRNFAVAQLKCWAACFLYHVAKGANLVVRLCLVAAMSLSDEKDDCAEGSDD